VLAVWVISGSDGSGPTVLRTSRLLPVAQPDKKAPAIMVIKAKCTFISLNTNNVV